MNNDIIRILAAIELKIKDIKNLLMDFNHFQG